MGTFNYHLNNKLKDRKMKTTILTCVLLGLMASAYAEEFEVADEASGRFLYFNSSSTATSITLLGAVILLGVIAYLVYVGGLLGTSSSYNRNDYYEPQYDGAYAPQYRSANDGFDYNGLNVIQWISMLQDLYEKFDYNDLDCQKKLICEVMREPEYYGSMAQKFKN